MQITSYCEKSIVSMHWQIEYNKIRLMYLTALSFLLY